MSRMCNFKTCMHLNPIKHRSKRRDSLLQKEDGKVRMVFFLLDSVCHGKRSGLKKAQKSHGILIKGLANPAGCCYATDKIQGLLYIPQVAPIKAIRSSAPSNRLLPQRLLLSLLRLIAHCLASQMAGRPCGTIHSSLSADTPLGTWVYGELITRASKYIPPLTPTIISSLTNLACFKLPASLPQSTIQSRWPVSKGRETLT